MRLPKDVTVKIPIAFKSRLLRNFKPRIPQSTIKFQDHPPTILMRNPTTRRLRVLLTILLQNINLIRNMRRAHTIRKLLLSTIRNTQLQGPSNLRRNQYSISTINRLTTSLHIQLRPYQPHSHRQITNSTRITNRLLTPLRKNIRNIHPNHNRIQYNIIATSHLSSSMIISRLRLLINVRGRTIRRHRLIRKPNSHPLRTNTIIAPSMRSRNIIRITRLISKIRRPTSIPINILLRPNMSLRLTRVRLTLNITRKIPDKRRI